MTMSASSAAWRTGNTRSPAFCALATDALVLFRPTITSQPESDRFMAWAWPCDPKPITAIFLFLM